MWRKSIFIIPTKKCNKPFYPFSCTFISRLNKLDLFLQKWPKNKRKSLFCSFVFGVFFPINFQLSSDGLKLQTTFLRFNIILRKFPRENRDLFPTHFERFFAAWLLWVTNIMNDKIPKNLLLSSPWMRSEDIYVQNVLQTWMCWTTDWPLLESVWFWNYDLHTQDR